MGEKCKKSKVNHGQFYTSSSGKQVEERRVKTGCNEKCSFKCNSNIDNLKASRYFPAILGAWQYRPSERFLIKAHGKY